MSGFRIKKMFFFMEKNKKHDDEGRTLNKMHEFIGLLIVRIASEGGPILIFFPPKPVDSSMAKP